MNNGRVWKVKQKIGTEIRSGHVSFFGGLAITLIPIFAEEIPGSIALLIAYSGLLFAIRGLFQWEQNFSRLVQQELDKFFRQYIQVPIELRDPLERLAKLHSGRQDEGKTPILENLTLSFVMGAEVELSDVDDSSFKATYREFHIKSTWETKLALSNRSLYRIARYATLY